MPHEVFPGRQQLAAVRAMPRTWLAAAGVAAAVVLLGGGYLLFGGASAPKRVVQPKASTPDEFQPTEAQWGGFTIKPVEVMTFHREEETEGKIAINEDHSTPVFSPYSGRVTRLIAAPGERVEKGAPLFAIEATENVQALNALIAASAQVNKMRSQVNLATINERRLHELYDAKAAALKDWQQSQADLIGAKNDLQAAETALAAARNQLRILGKSDKDIGEAEGAQRINAETVVRAPIAGTVLQRKVGLGQYLTAGAADPVFTIGDLSTVWLIANVKETDAPKIRLGAPVEVRVLAYPGRTFSARVTYVAPSVDPTTRRVAVRAEVENPDGALKPEMFASYAISTGDDVSAPAVPVSAIIYEGDTARVWVALDDHRIVSRRITTGVTNKGMVQVVAGLQPDDKVVTSGSLFIDRAARTD